MTGKNQVECQAAEIPDPTGGIQATLLRALGRHALKASLVAVTRDSMAPDYESQYRIIASMLMPVSRCGHGSNVRGWPSRS